MHFTLPVRGFPRHYLLFILYLGFIFANKAAHKRKAAHNPQAKQANGPKTGKCICISDLSKNAQSFMSSILGISDSVNSAVVFNGNYCNEIL